MTSLLARIRGGSFARAWIYLAANMASAVVPFLIIPVMTRELGASEYGRVAMFQAVLAGVSGVVGLNVAAGAILKFYDRDALEGALQRFIAASIAITIISATAVALVMSSAFSLLEPYLGISHEYLMLAILAAASAQILQIRLGQWQVQGEAFKYAFLQVGQVVLVAVTSVGLVVGLGGDAGGRIVGQVAPMVTVGLIAYLSLSRANLIAQPSSLRMSDVREALRFGVPLVPHMLASFVLTAADRFVVNGELGLEAAGIYLLAAQIASMMRIMVDAFGKAYSPWLFARLADRTVEQDFRTVRISYVVSLTMLVSAGLLSLVGNEIVIVVAGSEFLRAASIFGYLVLGQALIGVYTLLSGYPLFAKRTGALSITTVVTGAVHVCLLLFLVPAVGLDGAGIAFVGSCLLRVCLVWWLAQKCSAMPWIDALRVHSR